MHYLDGLHGSGRWYDCVDGVSEPIDEDPKSHGTALLALLLRLVPNAVVYAIRIAKNAENLAEADHNIAQVRIFRARTTSLF